MDDRRAAEHLEVIRTLMERAAIYRRALAPTALRTGLLGLAAGAGGWVLGCAAPRAFGLYWLAVALVAVAMALLGIRRQALRDLEPFWTPPTRRVTAAMGPPLAAGWVAGLVVVLPVGRPDWAVWWLPPLWMALYGCALHAAGFFMPRGIKLFGWVFVALAAAVAAWVATRGAAGVPPAVQANGLMAAAFGGLHLAYGVYLLLTPQRTGAA